MFSSADNVDICLSALEIKKKCVENLLDNSILLENKKQVKI